jgi:hypothetical protein
VSGMSPVQYVRDVTGPYPAPPTPPPCGKRLFDPRIARNMNGFNAMHFLPIDESVTTNPEYCPLFK